MCSKYAYPSCIYSHAKISIELCQFFINSLLTGNVTTLNPGYAQDSQKIKKPSKWRICTYHPPVHCCCGWAQMLNFIRDFAHASVFTARTTGNTTLLANKQLHQHSSDSHMVISCFIQTVHLLHKHSFITFHLTHFNIIHCKTRFSNVTSLIIAVSFNVMRKWILLLVFSPLSLVLYV
jgi:hypothetical protein